MQHAPLQKPDKQRLTWIPGPEEPTTTGSSCTRALLLVGQRMHAGTLLFVTTDPLSTILVGLRPRPAAVVKIRRLLPT